MKSLIVVGLQWGDEGKGKIVDALAPAFDYVVRWNGGNNAGHTVEVNGTRIPLSLVPSGVLQGKVGLIAQGAVINPKVLLEELDKLRSLGYRPKLFIDPRVNIVMPYHKEFDRAHELWKGKRATGSLHLGIGYCYEDRNNRSGIRVEDLIRPTVLTQKVKTLLPLKIAILKRAYKVNTSMRMDSIVKEYTQYGKQLAPLVVDVAGFVEKNLARKRFLFEQAHGTMLDPVFGTVPYTVAPPTLASSVYPSVGIPATRIPVLGVVKSYTTRVGNGPLPTEQSNRFGVHMQKIGMERGTVSGRVRRCGWLDIPQLVYAAKLNGVTELALTKLDVLTGLKTIKVCIGYKVGKRMMHDYPSKVHMLNDIKPVYGTLSGWPEPLTDVRSYKDLPVNAKKYVQFIEKKLGVRVRYISTGPDRKALLRL